MAEFFKNTFISFTKQECFSPGSIVEISGVKLRVKHVVAEGGYAIVYCVQAVDTGKMFALKKLYAGDAEAERKILLEIEILKKLSDHPNIVQFYHSDRLESNGRVEYVILMELCSGGCVRDVLLNLNADLDGLAPDVVFRVFHQLCHAVKHMHNRSIPIIHRDLKIENLLLGDDGKLKLCDFGSATTDVFQPEIDWNCQKRDMLEDQMAQYTTPMYRTPEMVDTWSNHKIGIAGDIWALGCILYTLCYQRHPFEDSAKLRILNADFVIPPNDEKYRDFHPFIRGCLKANPEDRFNVDDLLECLAALAEVRNFSRTELLRFKHFSSEEETSPGDSKFKSSRQVEMDSPPTRKTSAGNLNSAQAVSGLLSQLRGGAGSILKNIRDTSSKMVQSVQSSMNRSGVDVSYLTSRLAVMSYPGEGLEATTKANNAEEVRAFLEGKHGDNYCVFNVSKRCYPASRIGRGQLYDCGWSNLRRTPSLHTLYKLCQRLYRYLKQDERNACVIHCLDGKSRSALVACSFLIFVGFAAEAEQAMQFFAVQRAPPEFQPSELRYLRYFSEIVKNSSTPHFCPVKIMSITMQPVPLFNKARNGCRPYVEVYQGDERILTTQLDYDRMTLYNAVHGKVTLPISACAMGDVTLAVYHARYAYGRPTGVKILQVQIHTGFLSSDTTVLSYNKLELDDLSEGECYQNDNFSIVLTCEMQPPVPPIPLPWMDHADKAYQPEVLFGGKSEMAQFYQLFDFSRKSSPRSPTARSVPTRPAPPRPTEWRRSTPPGMEFVSAPAEGKNRSEGADKWETTATSAAVVDLLNFGAYQSEFESVPGGGVDLLNCGGGGGDVGNEDGRGVDFLDIGDVGNGSSKEFGGDGACAKADGGGSVMDLLGDLDLGGERRRSEQRCYQNHDFDILIGASSFPQASPQFQDKNASNPILRNVSSPNLAGLDSACVSTASGAVKSKSTPSPPAPPSKEPNYSRSLFNEAHSARDNVKSGGGGFTNKSKEDIFGDLLGSQGYEFTNVRGNQGPKTMNDMRRVEMAKDTHPDKLKVMEWTAGKTGNIRALLCSMHTVVWEGANWDCQMHKLVSPGDVKKYYRKACLTVHPDKQIGTSNESLAKMIFMELNNAWNEFDRDAQNKGFS